MKNYTNLKKEITFIYADSAEKSMFVPVAEEAVRRGYTIKYTDNPYEKCEIGFYCEHINFPQYSKFSVIMLHDIIQQYGYWPDIWYREPWDKYDIGFLPSKRWINNWLLCSDKKYANPRCGVFEVGWPKADKVAAIMSSTYREDFYKIYGLDINKPTILYAPSWENDGKQDDFVQSMKKLDVNILIKQANWNPESFPEQVQNIAEMKRIHEGIANVTILEPEMNIFEAIAASDVLVSEESSTMCEAIMMGIPAISVSNWLIPDVTPSRFPSCSYDFVEMTEKENLTECVETILKEYDAFRDKAVRYSEENFSNIGSASTMIMDIIDDVISGKQGRYCKQAGRKIQPMGLICAVKHYAIRTKREISSNYAINNKVIGVLYQFVKKCWYKISKKR